MARPAKAPEISALSRSVALPAPVWAKVDPIVAAEFTGNRSAYFARLVAQDLEARTLAGRDEELSAYVLELAAAVGADAVRAKLQEISALAATGTEGGR